MGWDLECGERGSYFTIIMLNLKEKQQNQLINLSESMTSCALRDVVGCQLTIKFAAGVEWIPWRRELRPFITKEILLLFCFEATVVIFGTCLVSNHMVGRSTVFYQSTLLLCELHGGPFNSIKFVHSRSSFNRLWSIY